jgi:hypothetical protein
MKTTRVSGRMAASTSAGSDESTNEYSTPKRERSFSTTTREGP